MAIDSSVKSSAGCKIVSGILAAVVLFGGGILTGRYWVPADSGNHAAPVSRAAGEVTGAARESYCKATTTFLIQKSPSLAQGTGTEAEQWLESQISSLTSRQNLLRVVTKLDLESTWSLSSSKAADKLAQMIGAGREAGTEVVFITARSTTETEAVRLANAVRNTYAERNRTIEQARRPSQNANIELRMYRQEKIVEEARLNMMEVIARHHPFDLAPLGGGVIREESTTEGTAGHRTVVTGEEAEKVALAEYAESKYDYETHLRLLNTLKDQWNSREQ